MARRYGVQIKTKLSFEELENVVGNWCRGPYTISLGGMDDAGPSPKKIMVVWCEVLEDRARLREMFGRQRKTPTIRPASGLGTKVA